MRDRGLAEIQVRVNGNGVEQGVFGIFKTRPQPIGQVK